jgi:hypothetical protein
VNPHYDRLGVSTIALWYRFGAFPFRWLEHAHRHMFLRREIGRVSQHTISTFNRWPIGRVFSRDFVRLRVAIERVPERHSVHKYYSKPIDKDLA